MISNYKSKLLNEEFNKLNNKIFVVVFLKKKKNE